MSTEQLSPMTKSTRLRLARRLAIGLAIVVAVGGLWFGLGYLMDSSKRGIESAYKSISPGMSRRDVRRLFGGAGTIMITGIGTSELLHIDGRFMIAVTYEPPTNLPPSRATLAGVPDDNWVAKEKLILELGRGSQVDNALTQLSLKSPRIVGRERMAK